MICDAAEGEALAGEFGNAVLYFFGQGGADFLEVVRLVVVTLEVEAQEVVILFDAVEGYVGGAVIGTVAALLYLLNVAQGGVLLALADGEGAVGKVDDHFTALQIVHGDRLIGVALGRVGQHQHAEVVGDLKGLEGFHERYGPTGAGGGAAHAGNVIDNEHGGLGLLYGEFEVLFYIVGIFIVQHGVIAAGVKLGAEEAGAEIVAAGDAVAVACPELACAELKVYIEHPQGLFCFAAEWFQAALFCQVAAYLHGQYGFAEVGIGKEDAKLMLVPEGAEQLAGGGFGVFFVKPFIGRLDAEEVVFRVAGKLGAEGQLLFLLFGGFAHLSADFFDIRGAFG